MPHLKRIALYTTLTLLGGGLLAPLVSYATLTLDSTSLTSDGALTVKSASSSATTFGHADQSGTITIASTTQALTLDIGKSTSALTLSIASGTGGHTVNIATGTSTAKTINIGTGASTTNTLFIGSGSSTVSVDGNLNLASSTSALTINIANGTGAHTINIGTGGTNAKTINIGTSANTLNVVTIGSASSTIAFTSASWTVTTAGTSTIVNKRTVTSSTFPTSPVNGQVVLLRVGESPYEFLEMTYDATYGKWVSQVYASKIIYFNNIQDASANLKARWTDGALHLPWKPLDTAGLLPEVRWIGQLLSTGGNTTKLRPVYVGYNVGDSTAIISGTLGETGFVDFGAGSEVTTTDSTNGVQKDTTWQVIPAGYTVKDFIYIGVGSAVNGAVNITNATSMILVRWVR